MARPPHFTKARSLFEYTGPAAEIIKSFKFRGEYFVGPELLRIAIKEGWLDWELGKTHTIVPVPLHRKRERQRGYNQALILARILAKHYDFPCSTKILKRQRHTLQQATLSASQRWKNVRGAFTADPEHLSGQNVLLVDDVMTTGATANECARLLKRNGAKEIKVFTLARSKS
jgi:ComF family protein